MCTCMYRIKKSPYSIAYTRTCMYYVVMYCMSELPLQSETVFSTVLLVLLLLFGDLLLSTSVHVYIL